MEEIKYPVGGFAPGYYMCKCVNCKEEFKGDKRATQCEPCAIEMVKVKIRETENGGIEIDQDYLPGFIDQFGDGTLGELNPEDWDALEFLKWLELNNYKIIKKI